MGTLDRINEMRNAGYSESQIITSLQQEGISPREINESLSQSKIKDAVNGEVAQNQQQYMQQGMQPSLMDTQNSSNQDLTPLPQEGPYAQEMSQQIEPPSYQGENYIPDNYSGQYQDQSYDPYSQQQSYPGYQSPSQDTVSEIASQIINEKMKKSLKNLSNLNEMKVLLTNKVEKIDERLERVEKIIDQLQTSLLRKATEQEQNISDIKTEMQDMQEGFSKILNPLFDLERSIKKPKRKTSKKKKH